MRLRVFRSRNWKGDAGYRWRCNAVAAHPNGKPIEGFSNDDTFTGRVSRAYPTSMSRAMTGARKHLIRFHRED